MEGFFAQRTKFPFKVLIYDDLSTDKSRDIIKAWQQKYPHIIETVFPEENQYSKGNRPLDLLLPKIDTEFISLCEGDDYWCVESKLQKQYDELATKPQLNICFHPAYTCLDGKILDNGYGCQGSTSKIIPIKKVIEISGGLMPMASMFIRTHALIHCRGDFPQFYRKLLRHSAIQIISAIKGGALYLPEKMSVYRSMHEGSWSFQNAKKLQAQVNNFIEFTQRNEELKKITKHNYDRIFDRVMLGRIYRFIGNSNLNLSNRIFSYRKLLKLPIGSYNKVHGLLALVLGVLKRILFKVKLLKAKRVNK